MKFLDDSVFEIVAPPRPNSTERRAVLALVLTPLIAYSAAQWTCWERRNVICATGRATGESRFVRGQILQSLEP